MEVLTTRDTRYIFKELDDDGRRTNFALRGNYAQAGLLEVLGEPHWSWEYFKPTHKDPDCPFEFRNGVPIPTAAYGTTSACCRIYIHPEGICISGGFEIAVDMRYAQKVYKRLLKLNPDGRMAGIIWRE